jgi:hypothetical protein
MKNSTYIVRAFLGTVLLSCGSVALLPQTQQNTPAAQTPKSCENMPYLHQNQFDLAPIGLGEVRGTVVDKNGVALTEVCVGVFSEPDHKLLRYGRSDGNGGFSVDTKGLPDATYRLVGQLIGFCPANAILNVDSHSKGKQRLVIKMKLDGAETCSTVNVQKK